MRYQTLRFCLLRRRGGKVVPNRGLTARCVPAAWDGRPDGRPPARLRCKPKAGLGRRRGRDHPRPRRGAEAKAAPPPSPRRPGDAEPRRAGARMGSCRQTSPAQDVAPPPGFAPGAPLPVPAPLPPARPPPICREAAISRAAFPISRAPARECCCGRRAGAGEN